MFWVAQPAQNFCFCGYENDVDPSGKEAPAESGTSLLYFKTSGLNWMELSDGRRVAGWAGRGNQGTPLTRVK